MSDPAARPHPAPAVVDVENPWLGLESFSEATARYFFGRRAELEEINERVFRSTLTVLFGPSGLGKTSLLQAGLLPRLRSDENRFLPVLIRLQFRAPGDLAPVRPLRGQVLDRLRAALAEAGRASLADGIKDEDELWAVFHRRDLGLTQPDAPLPVLLFDQFEEIFTLGEQDREATSGFLNELAGLVENRPSATLDQKIEADDDEARKFDYRARSSRVVLVIREEYLARLERWRGVMPSVAGNRMELRGLSGPQAVDAVYEPGTLIAGAQPGSAPGKRPPLVTREVAAGIVRFVAGVEPDAPLESIEAIPPLLSLVCRRLNDYRRQRGEETIGTDLLQTASREILGDYYEACFKGLPRRARTFVEDHLLRPPGIRDSVPYAAAVAGVGGPTVLSELVQRRLLQSDPRAGLSRIELIHDVLIPVVQASKDQRRLRRANWLGLGLGIVALTFLLLLLAATVYSQRAKSARAQAEDNFARMEIETRRAEAALGSLEKQLLTASRSAHAQAERELRLGRQPEAWAFLGRALRLCPTNLGAATYAINLGLGSDQRWGLPRASDLNRSIRAMEFSLDGRWLVTVDSLGRVDRYDPDTGLPAPPLPALQEGYAAVVSRKRQMVVSLSYSGAAQSLNLTNGEISSIQVGEGAVALALSPDERLLALGCVSEASGDPFRVRLLDLVARRLLWEKPSDHPQVPLAFDPDADRLLVGGGGTDAAFSLRALSVGTGEVLWTRTNAVDGAIQSLTFGPRNRRFGVVTRNGLLVMESANGAVLHRATERYVSAARITPDGQFLTWEEQRDIRCLDLESLTNRAVISCPGSVSDYAFSPDGRWIALATDRALRVIPFSIGAGSTVRLATNRVDHAAVSADGRRLAWVEALPEIGAPAPTPGRALAATSRLIDLPTGRTLWQLTNDTRLTAVRFSPDGSLLALGTGRARAGQPPTVLVVDAETGGLRGRLAVSNEVDWITISPDQRSLAVAPLAVYGLGETVDLLRLNDGAVEAGAVQVSLPPSANVRGLDFGPGGRSLVVAMESYVLSETNTSGVRRLDLGTPEPTWSDYLVTGAPAAIALGPGGAPLVVGTQDGVLRVVDPATGVVRWQRELSTRPQGLAISRSGDRLAQANPFGRGVFNPAARLVEVSTGRELWFDARADGYESVAFGFEETLVARNSRGEVFRLRPWLASTAPPEWLADWIEAFLALMRVEESGDPSLIPAVEVQETQRSLWARVEEARAVTPEARDPYQRLLVWWAASPEERTLHPNDPTLVRDYVAQVIDAGDEQQIRAVYFEAPWHPLILLALARFEGDSVTRGFLHRHSVERLATYMTPETYGRETCRRYCEKAVAMLEAGGEAELARQVNELAKSFAP